MIALLLVGAVTAGGLGVGAWGVRLARTTSDLFVASRAVTPWWNAAAISGEYLSAASFLGVAGLTMQVGASALWQPLGFAAGYLALLLFVAAPLRRYGAYTVADFAEGRLESESLRVLCGVVVLLIAGLYLVPQLKGAGLALQEIVGAPYWAGIVVVGTIVSFAVALGGMRAITYVQAFQFWVKLVAIGVPAILLLAHLGGIPDSSVLFGARLPHAPSGGLDVPLGSRQPLTFPATITYRIAGRSQVARAGETVELGPGRLQLPPGAPVPVAPGIDARRGYDWARPVTGSGARSPIAVYSLLLATFLGTMGLPHILVRFYTNRDGPAARRTTVRVLGLLAVFYLFPPVYGGLGRALVPQLYVTGQTDSVVLELPKAVWPGLGGEVLAGVLAAGAFAAFMSTSSGLVVSIAGSVSHDLWPGRTGVRLHRARFRLAAVLAVVLPMLLALSVRRLDISVLVGWAFALAASTFCPLFLLGIWWSRLTARAAAVGMVAGGTLAVSAVTLDLVIDPGQASTLGALLAQPAVLSVPVAFACMVGLSLAGVGRSPRRLQQHRLALHAPEGVGLTR